MHRSAALLIELFQGERVSVYNHCSCHSSMFPLESDSLMIDPDKSLRQEKHDDDNDGCCCCCSSDCLIDYFENRRITWRDKGESVGTLCENYHSAMSREMDCRSSTTWRWRGCWERALCNVSVPIDGIRRPCERCSTAASRWQRSPPWQLTCGSFASFDRSPFLHEREFDPTTTDGPRRPRLYSNWTRWQRTEWDIEALMKRNWRNVARCTEANIPRKQRGRLTNVPSQSL